MKRGLLEKIKYYLKYRTVLIEFLINIFSFSLLIIVQQIIALPFISRNYDIDTFGKIVLAFGIINIITSMLGFSIGNARLLDQKFYNYLYKKLLIASNLLSMVIGFIVYIVIFSTNYLEALIFGVICLLGNVRYFFISEYRIKDNHKGIFKQNVYYFVGTILGVIAFYYSRNWLVIFLFAEIVSVIATYYITLKTDFFKLFKDKSPLSSTNSFQLMFNNGVSYSLTQYDRFVIFPILGAGNVSLYYSTSISARIGSLIMNPLSNFILGKLAISKESINKKTVNITILCSIVVALFYFLLTVLTTPLLVYLLYPSFLLQIEDLIIPICLGTALMGGVDVLKPVIMKYQGVKYFNKVFLVYGIILIVTSVLLCISYGLIGVAIAKVIASLLLFIYLPVSLKFYSSKIG